MQSKLGELIEDEELLVAHAISEKFVTLELGDFIKNISLKYLPDTFNIDKMTQTCLMTYEDYREEWWVQVARDIDLLDIKIPPAGWVVLIEFHVDKLCDHGLDLDEIAECIREQMITSPKNDEILVSCAVSPNAIGRIEVYTNFEKLKLNISKLKPELVLASAQTSRHLLEDYDLNYLLARDTIINAIRSTEIGGIVGIQRVNVANVGTDVCPKWIATTLGTNLKEIFALDNIDFANTISNDMYEIWRTLGIEAARNFLKTEITKVLCFDGAYINHRHISLLVDSMTRRGAITSVTRDGIKGDASVLGRCMFETPVVNLATSSVFGEKDQMTSMSAAIMMGTLAKTGMTQARIYDPDNLPARKKIR